MLLYASMPRCWATLLATDSYLPGVLCLAQSLVDVASVHPLVVMVPPSLTSSARGVIERRGLKLVDVGAVDVIGNIATPRFAHVGAKLRAFGLPYERVVLLDADTMFLRNADELFDTAMPPHTIAGVNGCAANHDPCVEPSPALRLSSAAARAIASSATSPMTQPPSASLRASTLACSFLSPRPSSKPTSCASPSARRLAS